MMGRAFIDGDGYLWVDGTRGGRWPYAEPGNQTADEPTVNTWKHPAPWPPHPDSEPFKGGWPCWEPGNPNPIRYTLPEPEYVNVEQAPKIKAVECRCWLWALVATISVLAGFLLEHFLG